jgi:ABC-2 type transport system permease protein
VGSQLRKWRAILGIYFQDGLAYRASGLIWITTDLVTAVTMPLVWAAAAQGGAIQGYRAGDFVLYYLTMLLLNSFVTSHILWEIANEIRDGQFSTALVRPMSFYQVSFLRNLAWRIIRSVMFAPMFAILLFLYRGLLDSTTVMLGWEFWVSLVLGHLVSFTFVMAMSMIALFTQEAISVFELYYIPMLFLSGQLFPVAMLPDWARTLAQYLPFYYTSGAPTEILIGRLSTGVHQVLLIQLGWVIACVVAAKLLWARGLRYYTAVGM